MNVKYWLFFYCKLFVIIIIIIILLFDLHGHFRRDLPTVWIEPTSSRSHQSSSLSQHGEPSFPLSVTSVFPSFPAAFWRFCDAFWWLNYPSSSDSWYSDQREETSELFLQSLRRTACLTRGIEDVWGRGEHRHSHAFKHSTPPVPPPFITASVLLLHFNGGFKTGTMTHGFPHGGVSGLIQSRRLFGYWLIYEVQLLKFFVMQCLEKKWAEMLKCFKCFLKGIP